MLRHADEGARGQSRLRRAHPGLRRPAENAPHGPGLNCGKSGGYRLIYRAEVLDESWHVIFLATYFKGDCEDLPKAEYKALLKESEAILSHSLDYEWTPPPAT